MGYALMMLINIWNGIGTEFGTEFWNGILERNFGTELERKLNK